MSSINYKDKNEFSFINSPINEKKYNFCQHILLKRDI